jgi:hypothetical protein
MQIEAEEFVIVLSSRPKISARTADMNRMELTCLRDPLPEDALAELEHEIRETRFLNFAEEMRQLEKNKSADRDKRTAAKHLQTYIKLRLRLLELEWMYRAFSTRIVEPFGSGARKVNLPMGIGKLAEQWGYVLSKESVIAVRVNNRSTRKVLKKIVAEAAIFDDLLTVVGVGKRSELRPYSCLPSSEMKADSDPTGGMAPTRVPPTGGSGSGIAAWWLDGRSKIFKKGKIRYDRNDFADMFVEANCFAVAQRDAAILRFGYRLPVLAISKELKIHPKSANERLGRFSKNLEKDSVKARMLKILDKYGIEDPSLALENIRKKCSPNDSKYAKSKRRPPAE